MRNPALDIARGAAVLLVVPYHASAALPASEWIDTFHTVAGGVRMPLLMFICGLLTFRSTQVVQRVAQLGWLFIVWSTIVLLVSEGIKGSIPTFALLVSQVLHPTTGLWFLWAVAGMTSSLPLLAKYPLPTLAAAASLSMLNDAVQFVSWEAIGYNQTLSHAVFFYFGAFYGWRLVEWVETRGKSILWLVPVLAFLRLVDHLTVQSFGWQVFGLVERVVAICLALHLAAKIHKLPVVGSQLVKVGQNTLPLYVGHFVFIFAGAHLFGHLVPAWLAIVSLTIFALAGSIALSRASLVFDAPWLYKVPDPIVIFLRGLSNSRNRSVQELS
jgi:fucose 4-O-acetylase-like acetyltransferase